MSIGVINPQGMGAVEWCDRTINVLVSLVRPIKLDREENWGTWALHVIQAPGIEVAPPPSPLQYSDWREWADRFNQAISNLRN